MVQRVVIIALTAAALWFGYRWLFPNDAAQIRAALDRIEESLDAGPADEGEVSRLARAAGVRSRLDPKITVDAGPPFSRMTGRDAIIGTIARVNSTVGDLDVGFDDVQIAVDPDRTSAKVYLTAEARYRDGTGARGFDARELDVTFRRLDGDWVVSEVALVRTLEPVTPK